MRCKTRNVVRSTPLLIALAMISVRPVGAVDCEREESVVIGDFNGDGHPDLAIGSPRTFVQETAEAGVVHVLYGTGAGPGTSVLPQQVWHLDTPGVPGDLVFEGRFGQALAVGDFDCDGFDDLAIGQDGAVNVLYGAQSGGLAADGALRIARGGDAAYGWALAAGNIANHEGCGDELLVGAPAGGGGAVYLYYGAAGAGILVESEILLNQDSPGVPGEVEPGDAFGSSLVVANFDGDLYDDLAVGVPDESIGGEPGRRQGAVNVFYGGGDGLVLERSQLWHQNLQFVQGRSEFLDLFGYSLAAGDLDGDGDDELIVGVFGEDDENRPIVQSDLIFNPGAVNVFYGSPTGLVATQQDPARAWTQDSDGIEGKAEKDDRFGAAVASADFDGDGFADMAVGVPWEDREGLVDDGGAVHVIFGASEGLTSSGDQLVHQDTSGEWVAGAIQVFGYMQDDDYFGCGMAAGRVNDDVYGDLAVTAADGSGLSVNLIYGNPSGLTSLRNTHWICEGLAGCSAFRAVFNQPSAYAPVTDGIYTDPAGGGEWSDVRPLAFAIGAAHAQAVDPDDAVAVDSALYAALGPEPDSQVAHLNVLFDLLRRSDASVSAGQALATLRFPARIPGLPEPRTIGVHLIGAGPGAPPMPPAAFLDLDGDGAPDASPGSGAPNVPASTLGIDVTAAFAPSALEASPHLQVELRIPLSIPSGFPDPDGPLADVPGGPGGVYPPTPGVWTVAYVVDPPALGVVARLMALVEIRPDGSLRGSAHLAARRAVDVELLDDLGDGNGRTAFAILSTPGFDATTLFNFRASNAGDPGHSARPGLTYLQDVDADGDVDQVADFASVDLTVRGVVTGHSTEVVVQAESSGDSVAGSVAGLTRPRAGRVPGEAPDAPLTIEKTGSGGLKLYWADSCAAGDHDYAIYEGLLGAPGSHRALSCSTAGLSVATLDPGPDDHYYLVVPWSPDGVEGSYGTTSAGAQRPQGFRLPWEQPGPAACLPRSYAPTCGPAPD